MSRGRGRRHNQLPGDDLVAIAVVRERADHGGSPAFSGVWHTHIVLGSARVAQVDTVQNAHSSIRNPYRIIATASAFTRWFSPNDGVLLGVPSLELQCQTIWG